jgi:lysylphosphatidylglycerol synthetase-like protein (DUF2156 family)
MNGIVGSRNSELAERLDLLRKYGRCSMAYSSLQDGMEFYLQPGIGFIPYSTVQTTRPTPIVLGIPICAPENTKTLLEQFIVDCGTPAFMHADKETGKVLQELGFYVNEIGVETMIDINEFTLDGEKKQYLRQQRNRGIKDGVKVVEQQRSQVESQALRAISEDWMERKAVKGHEMSFLVRPAVYDDEPDVRKFYGIKNGETVGFVFFDPMYDNGKIVGYMANILRSCCEGYSVTDYIILEAMEVFRKEGIPVVSLGFSPFCNVDDKGEFHYSKRLKKLFQYTYEHANYLYGFKTLAFHKTRYRPGTVGCREEKVYAASKEPFPIFCLYGIFRKMGIRPVRQTASYAVECLDKLLKTAQEDAKGWFHQLGKHAAAESTEPASSRK